MSPESIIEKFKAHKKLIFISIIVLAALFIGLPLLIDGTKDNTPGRAAAFGARLNSLSSLASNQKSSISSSRLENQNTNLIVILSGGASSVSSYVSSAYGATDADPNIVATNNDTLAKITSSLTQSRLSNTYEKTYRQQVTIELSGMYREANYLSAHTGAKGKALFSQLAGQIKASFDGFSALDKQTLQDSGASN